MSDHLSNPHFLARVEHSRSRMVKIVFPKNTNHYDTLFGGTALQWMDEIASIAAIRFSRQQTVTISLDAITFKKAIPSGHFVELVAEVVDVGRTSMKIQVDVFLEAMDRDFREKAISGGFTFVAIDAERKPVAVEWDKPLPPSLRGEE
ncbi:acyl-CoA thioesterase [bacterium (Candidatus Blackallbacteria) CG17_big_fil_post_rev_8_21_14_2_50_48_46]|uniref:Acyl-CoA thioesterase n=1 Tax=bacterium (Candidatus Blackallbacteria) CG17_big_fil_post_rev_8_21_14_2_50_48_46 TaxID=2014261 RepID=A0A2M7GBG4_9BACT|nr:MAG: acyl-CoA thioesterase [bacterium (Candidatus Blackallbacteria) CG18_big_fil_WC_8_21_14_2_50_49_26]PIW19508.1 MAG: acyl-CoA thioesterase [bacterium (Candidatus Blackallbacteria) CG17_big_fil_post_rev_8_21_14_2_50_48_46]PIW48888.1 MAG: acyl-CoA thioesterase [bacterium (Candidatus Blackallbacteria) CG13_big_fil_rev_8_21_14_2_50_49_14]